MGSADSSLDASPLSEVRGASGRWSDIGSEGVLLFVVRANVSVCALNTMFRRESLAVRAGSQARGGGEITESPIVRSIPRALVFYMYTSSRPF